MAVQESMNVFDEYLMIIPIYSSLPKKIWAKMEKPQRNVARET